MMKKRAEFDYLGKMYIPSSAYYGVQTQRALENYDISSYNIYEEFIVSLAQIKIAAAKTNMRNKELKSKIGNAIVRAATEISKGKLLDQFVVDVFQAGAGTSENMNMNEVVANRALHILGKRRGNYKEIHPNDHVNMSQSTNDVYPTAMRITCLKLLDNLDVALVNLEKSFRKKSKEFQSIIKSGRTHLQDAVPLTLGNEFGSYSTIVSLGKNEIKNVIPLIQGVGIGGTAVGTGINTHLKYKNEVVKQLNKITKLKLKSAKDNFAVTNSMAVFTQLSGTLRDLSVELIKIGNDLRLLQSGPNTGINEIILPEVQPGSSIMPGKINPSIVECMEMVCYQVIGNDLTISSAAQGGQLELNVFMPVINYNLLQSIKILTNAVEMFDTRCVRGIKANKGKIKQYFENSVGLATILNPVLGYTKSSEIVKESKKTGKSIKEIVIAKGLLNKKEFEDLVRKSI